MRPAGGGFYQVTSPSLTFAADWWAISWWPGTPPLPSCMRSRSSHDTPSGGHGAIAFSESLPQVLSYRAVWCTPAQRRDRSSVSCNHFSGWLANTTQRADRQRPRHDQVASRRSSSRAPRLDSGSFRLPHFGDCTHEGQPERHGHSPINRFASATRRSKLVVAAAGDPDAARMSVVDEDRWPTGLGVHVGGEAADIPPVAHRDQRQHGDLSVLEGVQRSEQPLRRERLGGRSARPARTTARAWGTRPSADRGSGSRSRRGPAGACAGSRARSRRTRCVRTKGSPRHVSRWLWHARDVGHDLALGLREVVAIERVE